jgi:uncharacterized protein (DUF1501 family)
MRRDPACGSKEHDLSRRGFLAGLAATAVGALATGPSAALAGQLEQGQKRVLMIFLAGGVSQLETWDPKPGTDTGGPFQTIATIVPGVHICELLPYTAQRMHKLALVRGLNTAEDDHGKGEVIMQTGRRPEPAMTWPHIGSVAAKLLAPENSSLPGYIHITPKGNGTVNQADAAFLGPRFASVSLGDGQAPANLDRPADLDATADRQRQDFRARANERFAQARRTAQTEAYTSSYDQAAQLMARRSLFDVARESPRVVDRYGTHDFARHCLMARRLLEGGAPFVKVTHSNYDTHHENFDFHIEQLGEFDQPFTALLDDLENSGLLESTLVLVLSEFGRMPTINRNFGRDHWSKAWSVALGGCGIRGGSVVGKTNANGTAVTDGQVHGGHLFHTYLKALGLDPKKNFYVDQRPLPMADPKATVIAEVLA